MATKPNKALAKARRKRRTLSDVVAAEAQLDAGTFGLCEAVVDLVGGITAWKAA